MNVGYSRLRVLAATSLSSRFTSSHVDRYEQKIEIEVMRVLFGKRAWVLTSLISVRVARVRGDEGMGLIKY